MNGKNLKACDHVQYGNNKLDDSIIIYNCCAARDCPSRVLGLCQCPGDCYADKPEKIRPAVLPYRRRQRAILTAQSADEIAGSILAKNARKKKPGRTFRFNEAGDFGDIKLARKDPEAEKVKAQADVDKMVDICRAMIDAGITCYGYTARTDLDLSRLLTVAGVNVSNDLNEWRDRGANRFVAVETVDTKKPHCNGDCGRSCTLCQRSRGMTIQVAIH